MNPLLSLIIAVYNKPDFLEKILLSLKNQTFRGFEVLVADDGSGPEIAETIKKFGDGFQFPVHHVWHEDCGFRKTIVVNEAIARAKADYIVFIDGDCILHHRFLERHYLRRRKGVVLAGHRVKLDRELSASISADDIRSCSFEKKSFWRSHCYKHHWRHGIYFPPFFYFEYFFGRKLSIIGSNFSVHKSDLAEINGYDETIIGRGFEDTNLTARFRLQGIRIKSIIREALQYHLFHKEDPIPHNAEAITKFCNPDSAWAPTGLDHHTKPLD
ncbi:MAG: glycosyltransferase [Fibrobacteres bacterium]|nr:glycosyltransferase [Fibrobacterota bacterium]